METHGISLEELTTALETPTPELIEELSKRIHEALGLCNHLEHARKKFGRWDTGPDSFIYDCPCGERISAHWQVPNYTLPENFWPLAWKLMSKHYAEISAIKINNNTELWITRAKGWTGVVTHHIDHGIAVCLAYLKVEERENEG